MRYVFFFVSSFFITSLAFAQSKTTSKSASQTNVKQSMSVSTQSVRAQQEIKNVSSKSDVNKAEDYSRSEVLVDKISYENDNITYSDNEEIIEPIDPDALPYSYGQIKGVMNMDGKNIIVLESDDGSINFIYVYNDRGKMKWKLYGKIKRSY